MRQARTRSFLRWNPKGPLKDWSRRRALRGRGIVPVRSGEMVFHGEASGRWPVLPRLLPEVPSVWSFGVGRDLSFECSFLARHGGRVRAFDPTPRSRAWVTGLALPSGLDVEFFGLGRLDGEQEFSTPRDLRSANYHGDRSATGCRPVMLPVRRLPSLLAESDSRPDVLKVDIEGGEYDVLLDLAGSGVRQLLVEFHHGMFGRTLDDTHQAWQGLLAHGYELFWVSRRGLEFGFVR